MFKTLLANRTQKSATLSQRIMLDENCDEALSYNSEDYSKLTLKANRKYCLNATDFFLVGSKGAKISYERSDGTFTAQTSDAIGATSELKNNQLNI